MISTTDNFLEFKYLEQWMANKINSDWEQFLTPEILRSNLLLASLYLTVFELLKDSIVDRIRDFYFLDIRKSSTTLQSRFQNEVLSRNNSPVYASLDWLKENQAINDADICLYNRVREFRNYVAHELPKLLADGFTPDLAERFLEIISLLHKIERWWIVNVDLLADERFDGKEVKEEDIVSGPVATIKILVDIALGSNEQAETYIKEYKIHKLFGLI